MCRLFLLLLIVSCTHLLYSQGDASDDYFIIEQVHLKGNKKTKAHIIFRELDLLPGDTVYISEMAKRIELNKLRVLSTSLFTYATIQIRDWNTTEQTADILIDLQENWYIYPAPIFELADRSFNVWWKEMNRSLDRVNYGLRLDHMNTTGNFDRLKLIMQFGYTRKYEVLYNYPYFGKDGWGLETNTLFTESREIGYATGGNKTLFYKADDDRRLRSRFRTGLNFTYRPNLFWYQSFRLEFHRNTVDPIVPLELNPNYFDNGATSLKFFLLSYDIQLDNREFKFYPIGGYRLNLNIKKEGLYIFDEFNNLSVTASYEGFKELSDRWIFATKLKAKTNLIRNRIAFANNTGLGYGTDLVRGYELYVLDGTDWLLSRNHISFKAFETVINNKVLPLRQFKKMDIKFYLRWMTDFGYVNEPTYVANNELNNRLLVGYGPALDVILFNTLWVNIEYSFNHLNERGLYLKLTNSF